MDHLVNEATRDEMKAEALARLKTLGMSDRVICGFERDEEIGLTLQTGGKKSSREVVLPTPTMIPCSGIHFAGQVYEVKRCFAGTRFWRWRPRR
jgi:hypothetical protein